MVSEDIAYIDLRKGEDYIMVKIWMKPDFEVGTEFDIETLLRTYDGLALGSYIQGKWNV